MPCGSGSTTANPACSSSTSGFLPAAIGRPALSVALGAAASSGSAAPPAPPEEFLRQQSPTRPAPFPIAYRVQGDFDARLKGLFAPIGFKVAIVADAPTVINPVGM